MRLELAGTQEIEAPAAVVWKHLIDHEFVGGAAPGLESVAEIDAEHFRVVAGLGVGSIKLRFTLQVALFDLEAPRNLKISVKGDAPGSAMRAEAQVSLVQAGQRSTRLDWALTSDVHGTIASIGARMLQGTVRRLTESFWKKFAKRVTARRKRKKA